MSTSSTQALDVGALDVGALDTQALDAEVESTRLS